MKMPSVGIDSHTLDSLMSGDALVHGFRRQLVINPPRLVDE